MDRRRRLFARELDSNLPPELRPRLQNLLDEVKNPTKVSEDVRAPRPGGAGAHR